MPGIYKRSALRFLKMQGLFFQYSHPKNGKYSRTYFGSTSFVIFTMPKGLIKSLALDVTKIKAGTKVNMVLVWLKFRNQINFNFLDIVVVGGLGMCHEDSNEYYTNLYSCSTKAELLKLPDINDLEKGTIHKLR